MAILMPLLGQILLAPENDGGSGGTGEAPTTPSTKASESGGTGRVRINLDVSPEIAEFLDTLAQENATTKTDVMRRAIALLKVAHEEKKRHRSMGFVSADRDEILETKVVGVL